MAKARQSDTWPDRRTAAAELSVLLGEAISVNTLMGWARQVECPLPTGRGPIPKEELTLWARTQRRPGGQRSRMSGGQPVVGPDGAVEGLQESFLRIRILEETVRKLEGQNAKLYAESINAAEARTVILRACSDLTRTLTEETPSRAWALSQGRTLDDAAPDIRRLLIEALNTFAKLPMPGDLAQTIQRAAEPVEPRA